MLCRFGGAGALAGRDRAACRRPLAAAAAVGGRPQPAPPARLGWRLPRRSRIGAVGCVGVRLLLVVGDWSRAPYGHAVGCGAGGSRGMTALGRDPGLPAPKARHKRDSPLPMT